MPPRSRLIKATVGAPITVKNSKTLTGSATTVATPIFRCTGSVLVLALYGEITTALGASHTAAFWRLNDQTAQVAITLATGTTLSAKAAGSLIVKKGLVGAALVLLDNAAGVISEPTTLETLFFSPFAMTKKTAATTDIEYVYTTADTPTSGAIQHVVQYVPLSGDGALVAV